MKTSIFVPDAFTQGTNHFAHSDSPADEARAANVREVANAIVEILCMPFGTRPFRRQIVPSQDGAEIVNAMADRVRAEMLRRIGQEDMLYVSHRC